MTIRADEFAVHFDRLFVSTTGLIKPLQLLIHPSEFVPGHGIFGVSFDGPAKLPLGIGPLLLLRTGDPLFICFACILRGQGRREAEGKSLNVGEPPKMNDADIGIIQSFPEGQYDRIGLEARKIGADLASIEAALIEARLPAESARKVAPGQRIVPNAGVSKHSRIRTAEHDTEITLGIRVALRPDDTVANPLDDNVGRRQAPVGQSHAAG